MIARRLKAVWRIMSEQQLLMGGGGGVAIKMAIKMMTK